MKQQFKLNARGFAHHMLIMLLIVGSVAVFGAYKVINSKADSFSSTGRAGSSVGSAARLSASASKASSAGDGKTAADCANLHRHFNNANNSCTDCYDAWQNQPGQDRGACVQKQADPTPTSGGGGGGSGGGGSGGSSGGGKTQDDCNNLHRHYDASSQNCTDCYDAWQNQPGQDRGACVQKPTTTQTNSGGGNSGSGTSTSSSSGSGAGNKTQADCNNLHRHFDAGSKNCTDCYDAWQNQPGQDRGACVAKPAATPTNSGGGGSNTNGGGNSGGTKNNGSNTSGNSNSNSNTNGGATVVGGDAKTKADCDNLQRVFNSGSKSCGQCITGWQNQPGKEHGGCVLADGSTTHSNSGSCGGYTALDGTCVPPGKIKEYCKNFHLTFNDDKNKCGNCADGYKLVDSICTKKGTDPVTNPPVLTLDSSISQSDCEALGRLWESKAPDASGNPVKGCAGNECSLSRISVVKNTNGSDYCAGYISKIDKASCTRLHRNWIDSANGCMQNHQNRDNGAHLANAKECDKDFSTYVFESGEDQCITASTADNLASIAKSTGKPLGAVINASKAQVCNWQLHKHWSDGACRDDKPAQTTKSSGDSTTTGTGTSQTATTDSTTSDPPKGTSAVTAGFCKSLGRPYVDGSCARSCLQAGYVLVDVGSVWDKCQQPSSTTDPGGHIGTTTTSTTDPNAHVMATYTHKTVDCPAYLAVTGYSSAKGYQCAKHFLIDYCPGNLSADDDDALIGTTYYHVDRVCKP